MKASNEYYLAEATPTRAVLHMCLPMLAAMAVNVLANLVDAFFIGQLGKAEALAAVALALPFMAVVMAFGDLVGTGSATLIARLLGSHEVPRARQASATSTACALILGTVLGLGVLACLEPLCRLLGARGDTLAPTMTYIGILAAGTPLSLTSFVLDQNVRAEGASKASARAAIISTCANVAFDALFILGLNGGVAGAALATDLSWAVMIAYLLVAQRSCRAQSLRPRDVRFELPLLKAMLGVGFSGFALALMLAVSSWLLDFLAASYSTEAVAALGIALRIENLIGLFAIAFGQGAIPLFAFAYAAGATKRLHALLRTTLGIMFGALGIGALVLLGGAAPLVGIFSTDPQVIAIGQLAVGAFVLASVLSAGSDFVLGVLQSFGKAAPAAALPVARGVLLVVCYLVGNATWGLPGLLGAGVVAEACSLGIALGFLPMLRASMNAAPPCKARAVE